MNDFDRWATEFSAPEPGRLEAETIVMDPVDPIDCAIQLHLLAEQQQSEETRSRIQRLGTNALRYKYSGQYADRIPLEVLINGGYATVEPDERLRKRKAANGLVLPGHWFIRGTLNHIGEQTFTNVGTETNHSLITLRISNPVALNELHQPIEELELPDFVVTPVPSIVRYAFLSDTIVEE